jgi:hypothetical protein
MGPEGTFLPTFTRRLSTLTVLKSLSYKTMPLVGM